MNGPTDPYLTPEDREWQNRVLAEEAKKREAKLTDAGAERILTFLRQTEEVALLSDLALADWVIERVWGHLNLGSLEDVHLNELINRFERAKGIEREDEDAHE